MSHSDGFMTTEFVVNICSVPVIGILGTTSDYYRIDYTDDQELIQKTLNEVYLLMDKKYDADQQKKRSDIEKAKDALTRHKKYNRPWLYE